MASWFLVGMSAMAWIPQSSQHLSYWWYCWWSWCCAPIILKSMIWWKQRWLEWSNPQLLLFLALIPAPLWYLASFLLPCPWPKLGHLPLFGSSWELADHGDKSWFWKLNGTDAGGKEHGWPGPLGLICPSVMAWVIYHLPSPRLMGLALSWACLPTHAIIPNNVNMASLTSPKLSPSPNNCHPIEQDSPSWAGHYSFC